MAFPSSGPPSVVFAEWANGSGTVGENMLCSIVPVANGPLRDSVSGAIGSIWQGYANNGLGHPPQVQAGLFNVGGLNAPALRVLHGQPAIVFAGRAGSWATRPHTHWAVFRPRAGGLNTGSRITVVYGGDSTNGARGIAYQVATNGTITLGETYGSGQFTGAGITLVNDCWYLVAITYATGTARLAQVYDFTNQVYITNSSTGTSYTGANVTFGGGEAVINAANLGNFDLYACGTYNGTMDPAVNAFFAALVSDPCAASRGTYAGGGTMVGTSMVAWDQTTSAVHFRANRPNLGSTAGYKWRLHYSDTDPLFTPSGATALGSLQASPLLSDATIPPEVTRWYKLEQTDGVTTAYTSIAIPGRRSNGDFDCVVIADSRGTWGPTFARALYMAGWKVRLVEMNLGGSAAWASSASASWQPNTTQDPANGQAGTTLLANAVNEATLAGISNYLYDLGCNDAGTGTTLANYQTYTNRILAILGASKVYICGPFTRSDSASGAALIAAYVNWLQTLANGTTRFWTSRTSDALLSQGIGGLSTDGVHLVSGTTMPGLSAARGVLEILEPTAYAAAANVRSGVDRGDGTLGTLALPAASTVLDGTGYGAGGTELTGTRTDAPIAKVRSGTSYGAGGTGLTGTLTVPPANQVLTGIQYGEGGNQYTGTLVVSGGGSYPDPGDVRSGVAYGSSQTGTLTLPSAGQVFSGVQFGAGGIQYTGTRTDAPIAKVKAGTSYGAGGNALAGTLTLPTADQVQAGVQYGEGGTGLTGTLVVGGGGSYPTASEIAAAVWTLADGIETGETPRQTLRLARAVLAGRATNDGTVFKRRDGTTTALTFVHDAAGNRPTAQVGDV